MKIDASLIKVHLNSGTRIRIDIGMHERGMKNDLHLAIERPWRRSFSAGPATPEDYTAKSLSHVASIAESLPLNRPTIWA